MSRLAIAALLALSLAISARAAPVVELTVDLVSDPGRLTLNSSIDAPAVGGIVILVAGASGFVFQPSPGLSIPDSLYAIDPLGVGMDALVLNNPAFGTPIAAPGQPLVLGHFVSPVSSQFRMLPGDELAGASLFDTTGNMIRVDTWTASGPFVCDPSGHVGCPPTAFLRFAVPEPGESVALGLFVLAALSVSSRNRSRRSPRLSRD
jgi:hypothetical protein